MFRGPLGREREMLAECHNGNSVLCHLALTLQNSIKLKIPSARGAINIYNRRRRKKKTIQFKHKQKAKEEERTVNEQKDKWSGRWFVCYI